MTTAAPLLTLVVPMYGVASFLPDFLASLDRQDLRSADLADVELVFVDDGSVDGSGDLVAAWLATPGYGARLIRQANAGPSAARNRGLDLARGVWVGFPDPDDVLGSGYLATVLARLRTLGDDVALAAARILLLSGDGVVSDTHPLHAKFERGSRVVDLDLEPDVVQLQAASAFYRLSLMRTAGLRWDPAVRPNFEDAYLTAHYLAAAPAPTIALMADAHYVYRRRADGSSLVQQSWRKPEKYSVLPRVGYLRLLQDFSAGAGRPPVWVQNLVLYDLLFFFREDQRMLSATAGLPGELCATFHDLVAAILALVDPGTLAHFAVIETSWTLREALRMGYQQPGASADRVYLWRMDTDQRIVQVRYVHGRHRPGEEFVVGGRLMTPVHAKTRSLDWFGRTVAYERIAWLPATASLQVRLDGRPVPIHPGRPDGERLRSEPAEVWRVLANRDVPAPGGPPSAGAAADRRRSLLGRGVLAVPAAWRDSAVWRGRRRALHRRRARRASELAESPQSRADRLLRERARHPDVHARFGEAWAFGDRDTMAQDNAEHLYRWVRAHRPEVNAWFVLNPSSSDWGRLRDDGFRLVDPRSDDFVLLMLNTAHRISSQADHYVVRPLDPVRFGRARGRFTFLQHGVIKDDLSRWLSPKRISLFVTTTPDEWSSIAADGSPYLFTSKEVVLTGQPRHDRLLALAAGGPRPRWLLVAPTWRRGLLTEAGEGNARGARVPLVDTSYLRSWIDVLASPRLRAWTEEHDLDLAFLPHPNIAPHLAGGLPDGVRLIRYSDTDVQQVLANTALMLTDYSSLAFEQAYLHRPVVYLQDDDGAIFDGDHIGRRGPWSYLEHGFGPVCTDLAQLEAAVAGITVTERGPVAEPRYAARMAAAFPFRDGRCCERVYDRIVGLTLPNPEALALAEDRAPDVVGSWTHEPAGARGPC